jgi:hypothetical protein
MEPSARIPKNFAPEKYTIKFSPDYSNLKYTITTEILINSLSDKFPFLILNADKYNYKIIHLLLYKFDNIADEWMEVGQTNTESKEHSHIYYYSLNDENKKYEVEEGLYIPIEKEVNKGEKLKLNFLIEGKMSSEMNNALYLATNLDEKRELFQDKSKFEEEWNLKYNNLYSMPNLSENIFLKNLYTIFLSTPAKLHLNMPCFDEPCYKAIYSFSLELNKYFVDSFKQLKCITNGSLIHVDLNKEKNKYLFMYSDSPLMSSYLFTFVIGNYDLIETVNENKTKIRVFTPIRNHHDGALCMNLAQYSLKYYEKFFDIPYFYEKLDFVPIPSMNFRAMENIGCIVFKNEAMLFSHFQHILEKKFVSRTICHEISHMWFGDLVTMEWWDDIWLNEGFARIFEFLCLNGIQPKEYKYWDNFIYYIYDKALIFDESSTTHPIVRKVNRVYLIDTIFDTISYSKGSSVIKMLMHYIGIDNFKKSISVYLKKYKYKNTETYMLWECFDEITKLKISELMNEWINFSGHPLLSVDIISRNEKYFIKLSQKSMLENDETIWKLPVFIKSKHFEICRLVPTRDYEISFEELALNYDDIVKGENFLVFNSDLKAFYRVKYDNEILLNSIIKNYKDNMNNPNNKIIKENEEKDNTVSDYDIFGLLSYELKNKNFDNIKKILNKIKPIENSCLLLTYIKDIYKEFKSKYYFLEGFEQYIGNEQDKVMITKQIKEYDDFFISLVDNDKNKIASLVKKFYINEENKEIYRNQYNDEFDSLYLYFRCIIDNNEEIAKNLLIPNIEKNFEFLNKNLKYTLIEMMTKYIYLIKDKNEQIKLINIISKDYINNYYSSSYYIRNYYQNAVCNFGSMSTDLFMHLFKVLIAKNIFGYVVSIYLQGKGNRRKIFDSFIEQVLRNYKQNEENANIYGNIFVYFSSDTCSKYYFFLKTMWFTEKNHMAADVLNNYFLDKFKLNDKQEGIEEFLNIVDDFSSSFNF